MDLNLTLLGEIITFAIFVWFTMKYVWPPLMHAMEERRKQIADGLAAAQRGQDELELAHAKSQEILAEAKSEASTIVDQAHVRAGHVVEAAKKDALNEGERLIKLAQSEIEQETNAARDKLMAQVAGFAIAGAEKILKHEINAESSDRIMKEVLDEVGG